MKQETIKVLEQEGKLFGLPLTDFGIWVALNIAMIVIPNITDVIGVKLGVWYYGGCLVVSIGLNRLLKHFAKKKYPKYVMSIIAGVMQPKVIGAKYGKAGFNEKNNQDKKK